MDQCHFQRLDMRRNNSSSETKLPRARPAGVHANMLIVKNHTLTFNNISASSIVTRLVATHENSAVVQALCIEFLSSFCFVFQRRFLQKVLVIPSWYM